MGAQQLLPPPLSVPFPPNHHHPGQQLFNNRFICIFVFFLTKLFALHSDLVHHVPIHTYIYAILFVLPILWAQMDCVCVCVCLHKRIFLWNRNKTSFWFCFNLTGLHISFRSIRSFMFFSLAGCLSFFAQLMPTVETTATMFQKIAFWHSIYRMYI